MIIMRKVKESKFDDFFAQLFPDIILNNKIITTIIYIFGLKFKEKKEEIDKHINTDI